MIKADYIFSETITEDKSLLEKCISLNQELKDALFNGGSIEEGMNFINFIQMYYSNDEIIQIWKSIERIGPDLTQSGMKYFRAINEKVLYSSFKKVDNHFVDLFSEFVRLKSIENDWLKKNVSIYYPYYPVNNIDYIPV